MILLPSSPLEECSELCRRAAGHPRDVKLFQGSFSTQQTRLEFASMASWSTFGGAELGQPEGQGMAGWHVCRVSDLDFDQVNSIQ